MKVKQMDLGTVRTKDIRSLVTKEVALILAPRILHVEGKNTRESSMALSGRLVDLVEKRLRGLPACDVCRDTFKVCSDCGSPLADHEGEHDFTASDCEACPFLELSQVVSV